MGGARGWATTRGAGLGSDGGGIGQAGAVQRSRRAALKSAGRGGGTMPARHSRQTSQSWGATGRFAEAAIASSPGA